MEPLAVKDGISEDFKRAKDFFKQRDFVTALEITEDSISVNGKSKNSAMLCWLQGTIFSKLAEETENNNVKSALLLGARYSFGQSTQLVPCSLLFCHCTANSLFSLGQHLSSNYYYEETVKTANEGLSLKDPKELPECIEDFSGTNLRKDLEALIKLSKEKMIPCATDLGSTVNENDSFSKLTSGLQKRLKRRKSETQNDVTERLKSFWVGMGIESKRDFMKVNIKKLRCYVEGIYGRETGEALDRDLAFAKTSRKWKLWKCRACAKEFHRSGECKKHLEQEHGMKFRNLVKCTVPQQVDEICGKMISSGDWEPVETEATVEMIKSPSMEVKEFVYVNGWSKDWPLTNDFNRRTVLKQIYEILQSLLEQKALSRSIWDWIMNITIKWLGLLGVPQQLLDDYGLVSTPQCICFLELEPLKQIQQYLACTGTEETLEHLTKAVDDYWEHSRIKERISYDDEYSCLLLDRRLLRGKIGAFDDEGAIDVCGSNDHYARVSPQGEEIISWLLDCPQIDQQYTIHRPIRLHNLGIGLAILRIFEASGIALAKIYKSRLEMLAYNESLMEAGELCDDEDKRRSNVPKSEWKTHARVLYEKCEEYMEDDGNPKGASVFLSAIRDIVEGSTFSNLTVSEWEISLNRISELSDVTDEFVAQSLKRLKSILTDKISLMDSKILVHENMCNQLLNDLTRLSMLDFRSFILPFLKRFLRNELDRMVESNAKARSAEAEAALLAEIKETERKKPPLLKKKKKDNKKFRREDDKGTPASKFSPIDQNAELEPCVMHESGPAERSGNIVELKETRKKDFVRPGVNITEEVNTAEDACADETPSEIKQPRHGESSIAFDTDNQKEDITKEMGTIPGDAFVSQPDDLGSSDNPAPAASEDAVRYDSVLDMILKSLWHIRFFREELVRSTGPVHSHAEDQCVICALRDLFSAFQTEQINDEGLYHYLLNDLHIALENTHPTANDAAFLLIAIFDFLHCWKSPYKESLVTSIFTVEEFERMDCNRCGREPNYPEERSYGILISANSLRKFKIEFGDMKFEGILKAIRMNFKMHCDSRTGGCGKRNFVEHVLTRFPAVFTITLKWEENETKEEIYATMVALDTEIDIGMLYKGVNPLAKYHLASVVGCGEKEYNCIAYENNIWVGHHPNLKEDIGNWKDVLCFCRERMVRPEILFFEATWWTEKLQIA